MVEYLVKKKERETAIFEDSSDMIKFEHQEIEDVADFKEGITENGRTIDIFGRNAGWASHQDNRWAAKFVRENSGLITKAANEFDLSPDLLKAVVFTEMSRGWYDRIETGIVDFLPDFLPDSYIVETYLPGNVSKFWEPLIPGSDVRKKEDNLRLAAKLLKGIEKRLDHPHPEDVYSLYNGMAHDRTYENRKTKNTPFYLKVVLETKAWEYEDWRLHHAFPSPDGSPESRKIVWSGTKAPPAPVVPLEAPKVREAEWRTLLGPSVPPSAPKDREGEVEGVLSPADSDRPKKRSISPRGFHLLQKSELEAPGGAQKAVRMNLARMERFQENQGEKGATSFPRVLHFRRVGRNLRFDTTRPVHPNGRSLLTSAHIDNEFHRMYGPKGPDPEFQLPHRQTAQERLALDFEEMDRGRGRSFEEMAYDFLVNSDLDRGRKEIEQQEEEWVRASLTDPVVGGMDGQARRVVARSALNAYGDAGLYHFLDDSGLGNHPWMLRLFYRVGKLIAPGRMYPTVAPPDY